MKTLLCILILFLSGCSREPYPHQFNVGDYACFGEEQVLVLFTAKNNDIVAVRMPGLAQKYYTSDKRLRRCK